MFGAIFKTLFQMFSPGFLWVLIKSLFITALLFAGLFWAAQQGLDLMPELKWDWVNTVISFIAGLGLVIGFVVLLFPVAALFIGLFLEEVADKVERRHYPDDPPPHSPSIIAGLAISVRYLLVVVAVNLLLLPAYFLLPGINVALFFLVNGYLIGREYFEVVAQRHLDSKTMGRLRRKKRFTVFLAGLIIAVPLSIPFVNLLAPLFGTAFMVHVFKLVEARAGLQQT